MTADDRLSWLDALRFVWHFRWHPDHAAMVTYDSTRDVVRCECGAVWGAR